MLLKIILLVSSLSFSYNVFAINKCVDSSGKVMFQDRPCPEQTKSSRFKLTSGPRANMKIFNSTFGFSLSIPGSWISISSEEFIKNKNLLNMDSLKGVNTELINQVKQIIMSGKADVIFMPDMTSNFADNINVTEKNGNIPTSDVGIRQLCNSLPEQFSSLFNRVTTVYSCESIDINNHLGLYIEFDGVLGGTKSMQYLVQKSDNVHFTITATVKSDTFNTAKQEFQNSVKTLRMR